MTIQLWFRFLCQDLPSTPLSPPSQFEVLIRVLSHSISQYFLSFDVIKNSHLYCQLFYLYLQKKTIWYQKDNLQTKNSSNIALSILCLNITPRIQVSMTGMCSETSKCISRALIPSKSHQPFRWEVCTMNCSGGVGRSSPQLNTEALSLSELTTRRQLPHLRGRA